MSSSADIYNLLGTLLKIIFERFLSRRFLCVFMFCFVFYPNKKKNKTTRSVKVGWNPCMCDAVCRSVLPVYIERAVRSTAVFLQFCFSLWRSYCLPWCTWRIVVFIFRGFPNKDCDGETTCVPACFGANWSGRLSESRSPRRPTLDQLFLLANARILLATASTTLSPQIGDKQMRVACLNEM